MKNSDMKHTFLGMMKTGRTVAQILDDIDSASKRNCLNPKTIPETLRILEEARREYVGAI